MALRVIGAGLGRTGTYSLKLALERLGLGPCHHMEEVLNNAPVQVPLWQAAADGSPDWDAIYSGYESAVDWPTAGFFHELAARYPDARVILGTRDADRWAASYAETIQALLADPGALPDPMQPWLAMASAVVARSGIAPDTDRPALARAFEAHRAAVEQAIPAERLLVFQAADGWEPLCAFLDVPVPDEPFPRTNDRADFWDRLSPS